MDISLAMAVVIAVVVVTPKQWPIANSPVGSPKKPPDCKAIGGFLVKKFGCLYF